MNLLLLNGPNLNLLGKREPSIYGSQSLESIEISLSQRAKEEGVGLECFQSNSEGTLVDYIHQSIGKVDAILINAGAYTHTSIALRDALLSAEIPYVELHLSNTYARETFRQKSLLADRAIGVVSGFGVMSYQLAFQGILDYLRNRSKE
ncbi:type II 3-dehydroquinate dehydratase [Prochlorococcus marinus]|uniref:3-dehydroquinate dehydratase n=1 Tax=Prochlorococcus marinus (strain MIT 9211) TaxID=93059 RepID=AROQ_PROM4|nr:type II 3-dehydroquinate dehydratase [Prochlorococcus marinus]A9BE04.1 RecName: Full=3-dehydroquinate dehydratase; Short=3-dehydroquinase; AltName: Full=Type II DHQase [Prochlorococcus marinus str. MIT 9211]ABX08314.1 Dehydroquinase class II [Prochlorococcus marinus str. MIT 9211]